MLLVARITNLQVSFLLETSKDSLKRDQGTLYIYHYPSSSVLCSQSYDVEIFAIVQEDFLDFF